MVGELQANLDIPASTFSHHISRLVHVGLVSQERQGRSLVCRANYSLMSMLLRFLQDECCQGISIPKQQIGSVG